jgi:hypothetical protein
VLNFSLLLWRFLCETLVLDRIDILGLSLILFLFSALRR